MIAIEKNAFIMVLPEFGIIVDIDQLNTAAIGRFVNETFPIIRLASNQLTSFPMAAASGGLTWTIDTASGLATRTSRSFGPIFAERPLTIGRRRLNFGANVQHVTFDHLEDRSLRGGEIVSYLSVPVFDDHVFFANSLDLRVTTDTLSAFATYGITDRLDVGVAIPFSRVDVAATLTSRIGFTSSGTGPEPVVELSDSGKQSGIGDVVIRAKYHMVSSDSWGLAESVDVRLPTGDELNLLGIPGPQVKLTFIAASELGKVSPHVNAAYTIAGTSAAADDPKTYVSAPPEEINYAAGADYALSPRATVAGDVVGRVLRKAGTLVWAPADFGGATFPNYQQFDFTANKDLHLLLGSVGFKINPFKTMLFTGNVLFPLTKNGLTDRLTWMAGFDYSF